MLGLIQGLAGRKDETKKIYDEMLEASKRTPVSPYYLAILSVGLGDFDQAMHYFERAYEERDGILIYLPVDPVAESIWADPRFVTLVHKMGLERSK